MSQENVKPEQIQASVAAALSRLRGDAAPPGDAPDSAPPPSAPAPSSGPTGMAPGMASRPDPMRPDPMRPEPLRPANDLRAEPGFKPMQSGPMQSGLQSGMVPQAASEPLVAKEPELPRAMFSRPGPTYAGPTNPGSTQQAPQPEPEKTPSVQRPVSPLSRMMAREAPGAAEPGKPAAPDQQPDLLAGLPPPPLGDALVQEADDSGARRRRNRRMLMLAAAIVVVAGGFWLFTRGGGDSADVPVIAAEMSPEKVKPADEGGLQVPNQNVQVLDNMDSAQQPAEGETVLPPPEQPVTPPEPSVAEAPQVEQPALVDSSTAAVEDVPAVPAPEPEPTTAEGPAAPEPAAEPTQPATTEAAPTASAVAETEQQPAAPAPEAAAAPEPAPEPAPTATQEAAVTPPPAPAAVGNTRIQLAAVKSEDGAKAEWAKMQKAHPALLGNLTLTVERVDKGGGSIFYRIQAGPLADRAAAKEMCASLKQRGQDCIVAK